ncbi:MAG: 2-oxo acid dehydrogenase subunit E2 [Deltaproteobacteria bacterium]|jgi:pyruvate dehydrogenase E2 component (dihydrolipoamide acetyltransferase)|nr:2-oxo acid dehydrogenase subunit E2 [Deltaproteobacteria bacterium]
MIEEVKIPEISENVESGTVVRVLVEVGDMIDIDDVLVEFETEKALVDIPSTVKGKITELPAKEGDEMRVGDVIARVDTEGRSDDKDTAESEPAADDAAKKKEEEKQEAHEAPPRAEVPEEVKAEVDEKEKDTAPAPQKPAVAPQPAATPKQTEDRPADRGPAPATPSVRRFARELGVDIHDVKASGPGGRITEADVKAHVKKGERPDKMAPPGSAPTEMTGEPELPDFSRWGEVETAELDSVRRITAANMSTAWRTVPQVTQFDQADITGLQEFIKKNAEKVAQDGGKLTVTAILVKVCAAALKKFGRFNASIDPANQRLILKKYVHIGIAADTPRGLLVPVVRNADRKSISRLAAEISDLADRARNKKLKPDEMEGGTFTLSNQGGIGGIGFTPIVFWPQAAILGVSRATITPRYIDGEFKPRSLLPLSLSFDHRILDGADAARFLRWVCESLEHPFTMVLE